jgi:hypothetical protein
MGVKAHNDKVSGGEGGEEQVQEGLGHVEGLAEL